jgi:hypothetical protein
VSLRRSYMDLSIVVLRRLEDAIELVDMKDYT